MLLARVRAEMSRQGLQALIVTSSDPHNSEYVADMYKRRHRLCGFSGSAGTALVTSDRALLWTDGRYWIEASATLASGWELMKDRPGDPDNITIEKWIRDKLGTDSAVGVDASTVTDARWSEMLTLINIIPTQGNIVDVAEGVQARPPSTEIDVFPEEFAGQSSQQKLSTVTAALTGLHADLLVITALDEVAWLFNLRGNDVAFNCFFYAFAVVHASSAPVLFIDPDKLRESVRATLPPGTQIHPYDSLEDYIRSVGRESGSSSVAFVDPRQASRAIVSAVRASGMKLQTGLSIVQRLKALKNDVELQGFRNCHVRDGVALTRGLAWLDDVVRRGQPITDVMICSKLEELRSSMPLYRQLSFETIAGSGPHAAVIHRRCDLSAPQAIDPSALMLIDSGAHYMDGTTDVTRTVTFLDAPTAKERAVYTAVLKGHISLNTLVFPPVTGVRIDAMARQHLWRMGLDYGHGTGHGVGHCLAVHEGPHGIGVRPSLHEAVIAKTAIVSNEPGCYIEGSFGVRIENLEEVVQATTAWGGSEGFLTMRSLTMVPLCRPLIDCSMLTTEEVAWINDYHRKVVACIGPILQQGGHELDQISLEYLSKHCRDLP